MTRTKTLPKINTGAQFAARFQPPSPWLEERIRKALAERAEPVTAAQFKQQMKAIADGR
jgi:hypothetical protein